MGILERAVKIVKGKSSHMSFKKGGRPCPFCHNPDVERIRGSGFTHCKCRGCDKQYLEYRGTIIKR